MNKVALTASRFKSLGDSAGHVSLVSTFTLTDDAHLSVTRSLSRSRVSDDNPYSEARLKILKYHPGFPHRFPDQDATTVCCRSFFTWYKTEQRHDGIAMLTPETVHYGRAQALLEQRHRTLSAARRRHPERFVGGEPKHGPLLKAVWINKPDTEQRRSLRKSPELLCRSR